MRDPDNIRDAKCLRGQIRQKQVNIIISSLENPEMGDMNYLIQLDQRAVELSMYIEKRGRFCIWHRSDPCQVERYTAKAQRNVLIMISGIKGDLNLESPSIRDIKLCIQSLQIVRSVAQRMRDRKRGRTPQLSKALHNIERSIKQLGQMLHSDSVKEHRQQQFIQRSRAICDLVARIDPSTLSIKDRSLIGWATNQASPGDYPEMLNQCYRLVQIHYREDQLAGLERSTLQWVNRQR